MTVCLYLVLSFEKGEVDRRVCFLLADLAQLQYGEKVRQDKPLGGWRYIAEGQPLMNDNRGNFLPQQYNR